MVDRYKLSHRPRKAHTAWLGQAFTYTTEPFMGRFENLIRRFMAALLPLFQLTCLYTPFYLQLQPQVVKARWGNSPISSPACSPHHLNQYPEDQELMEGVDPKDFKELPHFADLSTYMIQQVIKFAKDIPTFRWVHVLITLSIWNWLYERMLAPAITYEFINSAR